jgi:acyl-CoA thioesterase
MKKYFDYFKRDHFASYNGIELVKCLPGYAMATVMINDNHLNGAGIVHGGLLFTLADFAFAAAVNSHGNISLSINASISFLDKGTAGLITAEAKEISRSNTLSTCDINITNEAGTLLANFKGTAYITKKTITF